MLNGGNSSFEHGTLLKRVSLKVHLGISVLSTYILDLLYFSFYLIGFEQEDRILVLWTHSLVMAIIWSLLMSIILFLITHDKQTSLLVGITTFSHWVVDFITWPTGVPME